MINSSDQGGCGHRSVEDGRRGEFPGRGAVL